MQDDRHQRSAVCDYAGGLPLADGLRGRARATDASLERAGAVAKTDGASGRQAEGEMTFQPAIPAGERHAQTLSRLIRFLAQQLDSTASQMPAAVCRELEHAIQI